MSFQVSFFTHSVSFSTHWWFSVVHGRSLRVACFDFLKGTSLAHCSHYSRVSIKFNCEFRSQTLNLRINDFIGSFWCFSSAASRICAVRCFLFRSGTENSRCLLELKKQWKIQHNTTQNTTLVDAESDEKENVSKSRSNAFEKGICRCFTFAHDASLPSVS